MPAPFVFLRVVAQFESPLSSSFANSLLRLRLSVRAVGSSW